MPDEVEDLIDGFVEAEGEDLVSSLESNASADHVEDIKRLMKHPHFTKGWCPSPAPFINDFGTAYCLTCDYNLGPIREDLSWQCPDCKHPKTAHQYETNVCLMLTPTGMCPCGRAVKQ